MGWILAIPLPLQASTNSISLVVLAYLRPLPIYTTTTNTKDITMNTTTTTTNTSNMRASIPLLNRAVNQYASTTLTNTIAKAVADHNVNWPTTVPKLLIMIKIWKALPTFVRDLVIAETFTELEWDLMTIGDKSRSIDRLLQESLVAVYTLEILRVYETTYKVNLHDDYIR